MLLKEKKERKAVTIEAILYDAVNSLAKEEAKKEQMSLDKDSVILEFKPIWDEFVTKIDGEISPKHPRSVETSEYGLIPQQNISSILRDRFGGDDGARSNKTRKYRFSLSKLEKLGVNYSSVGDIEIIEKPSKKMKTVSDLGDLGDLDMEDEMKKTLEKDAGKKPITGSPPSTTASPASPGSQITSEVPKATVPTVPDEEAKLPKLPEMPKELEDHLGVVTEEEFLNQESSRSKKPFNPIMLVEQFFSGDTPLLGDDSIEESPCYYIIGTRSGEISTDIVYYCKLHPDLGSTFLTEIEFHCQKEPASPCSRNSFENRSRRWRTTTVG